jgi:hypothetical protein
MASAAGDAPPDQHDEALVAHVLDELAGEGRDDVVVLAMTT